MRWLDGITDLMDMFEQVSAVVDGQGSLVCCSPRGRKESGTTERLSLSHKGFGIVSKAEIDVFLEFFCFFYELTDVGHLISGC